jgi:hypothetical protein
LARLSCTLGAAADLVAQDGGQLIRHVDPGVESVDAATAPVLTHVLGNIHVAASHTMGVGPLSIIDRPLAVARYSVTALDTLGDVGRGSPVLAAASFAPPSNPLSLNERLESGLRTRVTGPRPKDVNEITGNLDIGQALADLRYAAHDVAYLVRDVQHVPDQLLRSGLLFAPASKLTPSVERLHDRATGRHVSVRPEENRELAQTSRSVVMPPWWRLERSTARSTRANTSRSRM